MSDLIERQAAIDAHCELCVDRDTCNCDICPDVEVFQLLPSAQPEPQWIPCSERLPETKEGELKRCLLTEELHLITGETVIGVCVAFYDGEYNTWFYDLGEDMEEVNYPLAWMPLPEPYAERRTDETQNT